jgi:uncharacterized damage-inducible protein DinB
MKELLQQYAAYNSWANQQLLETVLKLPEEMHLKETSSSFANLHATILHMWDAESIWWQRMKLQETVTPPSVNFKGSTRDVVSALLHQNMLWESWVKNATEAALQHVFQYYNSKREYFKQPVYQALMQAFNHNTYHRGQIVTMLRAFNVDKIQNTDYISWTRKNNVKM